MTAREISPTEFAAIKTASRALVRMLGGGEAASLACRYNGAALSEACSLHRTDRTLPADVVADLERAEGDPIVTRVLAGMSGHALLPLRGVGGPEASAIAHVMAGAAQLGAEFAAAMADARVSAAERQALKDRMLALHGACLEALAALDAANTGGDEA